MIIGLESYGSSNHCNKWDKSKEVAQAIEESSFLQIMIMLQKWFCGWRLYLI